MITYHDKLMIHIQCIHPEYGHLGFGTCQKIKVNMRMFAALSDSIIDYAGRRQKLSATPDLSGTVLPLCLIPNSALKSAPPFKSVMPKASA
ncbi:hypothetical protein, partial [Pseudomonas helleri]|uniref:hypothetical protein n=1 Tax=Pseudomonas helleri TaxID=1608996 RepID=UPI0019D324CE